MYNILRISELQPTFFNWLGLFFLGVSLSFPLLILGAVESRMLRGAATSPALWEGFTFSAEDPSRGTRGAEPVANTTLEDFCTCNCQSMQLFSVK